MVSVSLSFNTPCVGAYCWRVDIDRVSSLLALLDELLSFFMLRVLSESDMPSMSNRSSTFFKVGVLWKSGLLDEHDSLLDDRVMVPWPLGGIFTLSFDEEEELINIDTAAGVDELLIEGKGDSLWLLCPPPSDESPCPACWSSICRHRLLLGSMDGSWLLLAIEELSPSPSAPSAPDTMMPSPAPFFLEGPVCIRL